MSEIWRAVPLLAGLHLFSGPAMAAGPILIESGAFQSGRANGPLEFLTHPQLTPESARCSSGTYGLMDQIAALEWVRPVRLGHVGLGATVGRSRSQRRLLLLIPTAAALSCWLGVCGVGLSQRRGTAHRERG